MWWVAAASVAVSHPRPLVCRALHLMAGSILPVPSADGDPAARNLIFVPNSWSLHEARSEAPAEDRIEKE
jgi:hypothetical protein